MTKYRTGRQVTAAVTFFQNNEQFPCEAVLKIVFGKFAAHQFKLFCVCNDGEKSSQFSGHFYRTAASCLLVRRLLTRFYTTACLFTIIEISAYRLWRDIE